MIERQVAEADARLRILEQLARRCDLFAWPADERQVVPGPTRTQPVAGVSVQPSEQSAEDRSRAPGAKRWRGLDEFADEHCPSREG